MGFRIIEEALSSRSYETLSICHVAARRFLFSGLHLLPPGGIELHRRDHMPDLWKLCFDLPSGTIMAAKKSMPQSPLNIGSVGTR